ncbi:hypothetical protein HJC23_004170 [Cyclotella cryptica]|uniref:Uncharacterized protein n=1 Tax=Cyclotella cryptica TaxID=29204 RepID=A0ABD3NYH0_9STRA|eukprot:CCRYP_018983-RA/>CCRYP_018983-RA protein AED:0.36 eAED:0.36 QI:0/-1/0/1/-1/1/1/0/350
MANLQPMNIQSSITDTESNSYFSSRPFDARHILCTISTFVALLLALDGHGYKVIPGAGRSQNQGNSPEGVSIPSAPEMTPKLSASTSTTISTEHEKTKESLEKEIEEAKLLIEQNLQELENLSTAETEQIAEVEGVDDTSLKAAEASTFKSQKVIDEEKHEVIEEIVEKQLGIDLFCPECTWQQTSYSCYERFQYIQKRYHTDEDDVVKESLLDQGCRRKGDSIDNEIDQAQLLIEEKHQELESLSATETEQIAEDEGIDNTPLKLSSEASETEEKEELIEEIVEKELGIDEFCPECTWQQTSYTCEARFNFIQKRYHTDEDDVVKESLLDQGCRRKSGGGLRKLRGREN